MFIDFCTLAKISILVMDEKYHGYYLHCRSPHQFADGAMSELIQMLHKEESGLTVDRSLEGAPADVQCFEFFSTGDWRTQFDKSYSVLTVEPYQNGQNQTAGPLTWLLGIFFSSSGNRGRRPRRFQDQHQPLSQSNSQPSSGPGDEAAVSDRMLRAWSDTTTFVKEFVDNNFGKNELRRIIKEKSYYEALFCNPPLYLDVPDQPCVFCPDRAFDYTKVLYLGCESDLLLLNILSYSLFDLWFSSTAISILLTYLLDMGLCTWRQSKGQVCI